MEWKEGSSIGSPALPEGQSCKQCGYDLRGLEHGGDCPECGASTARTPVARDVPLSQMSESLVRQLALCCAATCLVIPAMVIRRLAWGNLAPSQSLELGFDLALAAIWIGGVTLLTSPVEIEEARRYGLARDGKSRRIARAGCWGALLVAMTNQWPVGGSEVLVIQSVWLAGWAVCIVGCFCLLLLLAEVAEWVRDTTAKRLLESSAYGTPLAYGAAMLISWLPVHPIASGAASVLGVCLLLAAPAGMVMLTGSVVRSIRHAREYKAYLQRQQRSGP